MAVPLVGAARVEVHGEGDVGHGHGRERRHEGAASSRAAASASADRRRFDRGLRPPASRSSARARFISSGSAAAAGSVSMAESARAGTCATKQKNRIIIKKKQDPSLNSSNYTHARSTVSARISIFKCSNPTTNKLG